MDTTKPVLESKTVWTNFIIAAINLAVFLAADHFGIDAATILTWLAGTNIGGNLLAAWFRKTATAKLG